KSPARTSPSSKQKNWSRSLPSKTCRDASASGRNIVTRGVRLNELVGVEFLVGSVRFLGVELCEPCLSLGKALATSTPPPAKVVKRLVHRAGLRADALSSGEVVVGAKVKSAA